MEPERLTKRSEYWRRPIYQFRRSRPREPSRPGHRPTPTDSESSRMPNATPSMYLWGRVERATEAQDFDEFGASSARLFER